MGMRLLRFLIGLALIPCGVAVTRTLVTVLMAAGSGTGELLPLPLLAFGGGFVLWMIIFLAMSQGARSYVLAHELTHALWAKLFGKKVLSMRVGSESGAVTVSGTNMWITLAPYFFPLYSVLAVAVYYLVGLFTDVEPWHTPWLAVVGFTWAFHVTFTLSTLMTHQSDIQSCGRLFSYVFIYLMNIAVVTLWIVAVSTATFSQYGRQFATDMTWAWGTMASAVARASLSVWGWVTQLM
jgi:hypothetical protein